MSPSVGNGTMVSDGPAGAKLNTQNNILPVTNFFTAFPHSNNEFLNQTNQTFVLVKKQV